MSLMTHENRHKEPCRDQRRSQAMTRPARDEHLSWTRLGGHMGFTADESERVSILDAIGQMNWVTGTESSRPTYLGGPAARTIARVIVGRRRIRLHSVGIAQLAGGRRLIGLEDERGTRSFLVDLGAEAIHVLDEFGNCQPRVA
jgi:hypothetical protein